MMIAIAHRVTTDYWDTMEVGSCSCCLCSKVTSNLYSQVTPIKQWIQSPSLFENPLSLSSSNPTPSMRTLTPRPGRPIQLETSFYKKLHCHFKKRNCPTKFPFTCATISKGFKLMSLGLQKENNNTELFHCWICWSLTHSLTLAQYSNWDDDLSEFDNIAKNTLLLWNIGTKNK